jgi:hypothetical protein
MLRPQASARNGPRIGCRGGSLLVYACALSAILDRVSNKCEPVRKGFHHFQTSAGRYSGYIGNLVSLARQSALDEPVSGDWKRVGRFPGIGIFQAETDATIGHPVVLNSRARRLHVGAKQS